jgi:hypothetical protein
MSGVNLRRNNALSVGADIKNSFSIGIPVTALLTCISSWL